MRIKEAKHQIEITTIATDHRLIRDRWLNIKRILDVIYKQLSLLTDGQQTISINKDSLPVEQRKLFQSVLEKMLEDNIVDYYNHNNKIQTVVTSEPIQKFLRGENIIVKNGNIFENYRKEISEFYDFIEKDGRKRFPEIYSALKSGDKRIENKIINKKNCTITSILLFVAFIVGSVVDVSDFYDRFIKEESQEEKVNRLAELSSVNIYLEIKNENCHRRVRIIIQGLSAIRTRE